MKVLLSEGSGLTARQVAGRLHELGHEVGVVTADPLCLARFTRATRRWHAVPSFGDDPFGWFDATLEVASSQGYDVLLPTQEMVTVLSARQGELRAAGIATLVPPFAALRRVQDKISASETLSALALPQPAAVVAHTRDDLLQAGMPAWVKTPIGTAASGAFRVGGKADVERLLRSGVLDGAFADGPGVLVQAPAAGPFAMVQSLFDHGRLVAFHANERTALGARGGASRKTSRVRPDLRSWIERLGAHLDWHGALSADVIDSPDRGPLFIDVNPRLVEPGNAFASGTDLVGIALQIAVGDHPPTRPDGRSGVATHQTLLGVLGAADRGAGRRGILHELAEARRGHRTVPPSVEELTPWRHDVRSAAVVCITVAATVIRPSTWSYFSSGSVAAYALTPDAWRTILADVDRPLDVSPGALERG